MTSSSQVGAAATEDVATAPQAREPRPAARKMPSRGQRLPLILDYLLRAIRVLLVPALVVLLWWWLTRFNGVTHGLIPGPVAAAKALVDWIFSTGDSKYSGTWVSSMWMSTRRVLLGYAVGAGGGVLFGVLIGYFRPLGQLVEPFIHVLRSIPIIGWLPLSFVAFGYGIASTTFLIGMGTFFPVIVGTIGGVRSVDRTFVRVGRMAGCSRTQILTRIILPSALPQIVTSLRVAMGFAWILVIVAEWTAVRTGLGYVLLDAYNYLRYDYIIAAMVSVGFMGFISDRLVYMIARPFVRWHTEMSIEQTGRR